MIIPDSNKDRIAIIVVGYNRLKSIERLLDSVSQAEYPYDDIPLIISIDASGNKELYSYVNAFQWDKGPKYVNIQEERLGLKKHILTCGALTEFFKGIIVLEDDLFVSPYYYHYAMQAIEKYGDDNRIAEIALYKNSCNGFVKLPFEQMHDAADVYLAQDVCTWGECWTWQMWSGFKKWYCSHNDEDVQKVDMPERIKQWERAWSKYYNAYVVSEQKYIVYPNVSLTTNFSDAGEHGGDSNGEVQVNLQMGEINYRMPEISSLIKYDIYLNNELLYDWVGLSSSEMSLDLYGIKHPKYYKRYLLTVKERPYNVVKEYGLIMRPIELNVKFGIKGKGINLYDTSCSRKNRSKSTYSLQVANFFLNTVRIDVIKLYFFSFMKNSIKNKLYGK